MIKQWNKEHSDLLASFHIEVMAFKCFRTFIDDYTWAIFQYFDKAGSIASSPLAYEGGHADTYLDSFDRVRGGQAPRTGP
jgi:hypothetical protein